MPNQFLVCPILINNTSNMQERKLVTIAVGFLLVSLGITAASADCSSFFAFHPVSTTVNEKFVTFAVTLLLASLEAASADCSSYFVIHPGSTTVKENEEATFTCSVSNFTRNMYLGWIMDPENQTFSISKSDNLPSERTSTLTITGFKHIRQTQHCLLVIKDDINSPIQCESKSATLNVQYFPDADEIACGPKNFENFHIGDRLQAWCSSFEGNPRVQMQWQTDAHGLALTTSFREGAQILLEQELMIAPYLHGKTLKCIVSSPQVFPGKVHSCSVGTFSVIYKPNVSIYPRELHVNHNDMGTYLVECSGDAFPAIQNYSWMCSPANILNGCNLDTASINVTMNARALETYEEPVINISVACFVSNTEGIFKAMSYVYIMRSDNHDTSLHSDELKPVDPKLCLVAVDDNMMDNTWRLHWICSLCWRHNDFTDFEIQWSLDGIPIHRNNETFFNRISTCSFSLTINKVSLEEMGKLLECIVSHDATYHRTVRQISLQRSVCFSLGYATPTTGSFRQKTTNKFIHATAEETNPTSSKNFDRNKLKWIKLNKGITALVVGGVIALAIIIALTKVLLSLRRRINYNENLGNIPQYLSYAPQLLAYQPTSAIGSMCSLPTGTENESGALPFTSIKSSENQVLGNGDGSTTLRTY